MRRRRSRRASGTRSVTSCKSEQAPVASQIRQLGGQVLATYQLAYNGVKVLIAGNKAESLASHSRRRRRASRSTT